MLRIANLFLSVCVAVSVPFMAHANTFVVTTTADDGSPGSLRGAIQAAETAGGTNTVNVPAGTYLLTRGLINFGNKAETMTITGAGAGTTIIKMATAGGGRLFLIDSTGTFSGVNVTVSGITFMGGTQSVDGFDGGAIIAGGPTNTLTLTNCIFKSNTTSSVNGGALAFEGGGTLSITGCTFSSNKEPAGLGGAIYYFLGSGLSGSLTISSSTFSGNSMTQAGGSGGAIYIGVQGGAASSSVSITQNTFVNDTASGSGSTGGAIDVDNGAATTAMINFNRFYANIAPSFYDVSMNSASGSVDVSDNWWGINGGPSVSGHVHAGIVGSGGSGRLVTTPWIELKSTAASGTVCAGSRGDTTFVTAHFVTDTTFTTLPSGDLGAFAGLSIAFAATGGSLSDEHGTTGTATITFVAPTSGGTVTVTTTLDSVTTADTAAQLKLTVKSPTIGSGSATGSETASGTAPVVSDANCNRICTVVPTGSSPVSGTINASVTVDGSVKTYNGSPYVARHYDIEPATGASTATAKVTLYYLQSDFDAYNTAVTNAGGGASSKLPTGPTDAAGKANFTITQFHGTGTAPGGYTGWTGSGPATVAITPGASNVVWNSSAGWWEVSFSVTGFSGFFASGSGGLPLPVVLESFAGVASSGGVLLNWKVGLETGLARYEIESSTDGIGFVAIGEVAASGAAGYQYFVARPGEGNNFYRLRMVDLDGKYSYSAVVLVNLAAGAGSGSVGAVQVLGNPVHSACSIRVVCAAAGSVFLRLADVSGKVLWVRSLAAGVGANTYVLPGMERFAAGVYFLSVEGGQVRETVKVVKE